MAEQGYGGPEVKMQQLKMRLRAICNAILDQSIHAGNMSEKEAMDLMTKEAYQQEGEAVAKWKRARLTSAQLSTYFVGATEHLDLRAAEQKKLGDQFNLKKYNDQVISYGSPPVKYVREIFKERRLPSRRGACLGARRLACGAPGVPPGRRFFGSKMLPAPQPDWLCSVSSRDALLPSLRLRFAPSRGLAFLQPTTAQAHRD